MASTRSISSGNSFQVLLELGATARTSKGKQVTPGELEVALDAFNWDDFQVTRTERLAAVLSVSSLAKQGLIPADTKATFDAWLGANATPAPGGFSYGRRAVAWDNMESLLRWHPGSERGAKLTAEEATALLSLFGDAPAPVRITDVQRLRKEVVAAKQASPTTLAVLDAWLAAHPMPEPAGALGQKLSDASAGLRWPSESDYPVHPVTLGDAPANLTANGFLDRLGESRKAEIEERGFDDWFSHVTEVQPGAAPEEIEQAAKFQKLKDTLLAGLTDLRVFRVGKIDIDVYILGKTPDGKLSGVCTSVIET